MKKVVLGIFAFIVSFTSIILYEKTEENKIEATEVNINEVFNEKVVLNDDINWAEVMEVIVVHDDGTTPKTEAEAAILANTKSVGTLSVETKSAVYNRNISYSAWLLRSDGWTLSIRMKKWGKWGFDSNQSIFNAIWNVHAKDEQWNYKNASSMYNQFVCHSHFAKFVKSSWNIEPWRPDKGYLGFIKSQCN